MIEEANSEYEKMEATLNEFNNKFDEMYQEIEEKVFKNIQKYLFLN